MSLARLVVTGVRLEGRKAAEVARDDDVSRQWIYTLLARYDTEGEAGLHAVGEAVADAAPDQGDPTDALARVIAGLVACGDQTSFLFTHTHLYENHPAITGLDRAEAPIRPQRSARPPPPRERVSNPATTAAVWAR